MRTDGEERCGAVPFPSPSKTQDRRPTAHFEIAEMPDTIDSNLGAIGLERQGGDYSEPSKGCFDPSAGWRDGELEGRCFLGLYVFETDLSLAVAIDRPATSPTPWASWLAVQASWEENRTTTTTHRCCRLQKTMTTAPSSSPCAWWTAIAAENLKVYIRGLV